MAKGKKTGGRNFEKGHKPVTCKLPKDIREAKELTQKEFVRITCNLIRSTRTELTHVLEDPKTSALELMIGGIISKAIFDCDHQRAEFLLNRIIGRVGIQADINITDKQETPVINFGLTKTEALPEKVIDV